MTKDVLKLALTGILGDTFDAQTLCCWEDKVTFYTTGNYLGGPQMEALGYLLKTHNIEVRAGIEYGMGYHAPVHVCLEIEAKVADDLIDNGESL